MSASSYYFLSNSAESLARFSAASVAFFASEADFSASASLSFESLDSYNSFSVAALISYFSYSILTYCNL